MTNKPVPAFSPEDMRRRRRRNIVTALALVAMVVIFFISTLVRLGHGIMERGL